MTQTVFITGANRGIGHALARLCAARGDAVLGTARSAEGVAAIEALRPVGNVTAFRADVTDPARLEALATMLADRAVDLLVCNAGVLIGRGGLADPDHGPEAFAAAFMTNVAGPFFTVRAFLPHLRRSARGRVAILTSSMGASSRAKGNAYGYRASKAAATNLALNLAAELTPLGVAVGAFHPGWVRTAMGGDGAEVDPEDSAAALAARFDALDPARGCVLEDLHGAPLPA